VSDAPDSLGPGSPPTGPPLHRSLKPRTPPSAPGPLPWRVNLVLLLATILTTLMAGAGQEFLALARLMGRLDFDLLEALFAYPVEFILLGLPYAGALLAILLAHEMGHYLAAKRHGVDASLPFFIPIPFGIGTFGAVIRMRSAIPSRSALLDIALAGPIAGFVVALPVLVIGTLLSTATPMSEMPVIPNNYFGEPLIHKLLVLLLRNDPPGTTLYLNPFAFAGWVGLLVTFLNLFPVGQLDGGHVRYALFGSRADRAQELLAKGMLAWGSLGLANLVLWVALETEGPLVRFLLSWCSPAFFIWGLLLVLVFGRAGWEHPPVLEWEPLSPGRRILAAVGIAVFVLVFMPAPMATELG